VTGEKKRAREMEFVPWPTMAEVGYKEKGGTAKRTVREGQSVLAAWGGEKGGLTGHRWGGGQGHDCGEKKVGSENQFVQKRRGSAGTRLKQVSSPKKKLGGPFSCTRGTMSESIVREKKKTKDREKRQDATHG